MEHCVLVKWTQTWPVCYYPSKISVSHHPCSSPPSDQPIVGIILHCHRNYVWESHECAPYLYFLLGRLVWKSSFFNCWIIFSDSNMSLLMVRIHRPSFWLNYTTTLYFFSGSLFISSLNHYPLFSTVKETKVRQREET